MSVASSHGFRAYLVSTSVTNPRIELGYDNHVLSSSKMVQIHCTNLFITVGDGSDASSSSRIVRVIDITTNQERFSLKFSAPVLNVLATTTRLVVVLAHKLYVFDLDTCRQLHSTPTAHNMHGVAALYDPEVSALRQRYVSLIQRHSASASPSLGPAAGNSPTLRPLSSRASPLFAPQNGAPASFSAATPDLAPIAHPFIVYPVQQTQTAPAAGLSSSLGLAAGPPQGVLEVLDLVTLKPITLLQACAGPVRSIAVGGEGHMVAVASTKGTIIRVLNTLTGMQLFCFRRGRYDGDISHLVFAHKSEWLACVNASSNSIHVFSLDPANKSQETVQEDAPAEQTPGRNSPEFMALSAPATAPEPEAPAPATNSGISGFFSWSSLSAASSAASSLMKSTASSLASSLTTISSTLHSYIEPPRRFAWIGLKLPRPTIKTLCVGFTRGATMLVATSDGMVYVYTIPKASGECALVHQVSLARNDDAHSTFLNVNGQTVAVTNGADTAAAVRPSLAQASAAQPALSHSPSVSLAASPLPHAASAPATVFAQLQQQRMLSSAAASDSAFASPSPLAGTSSSSPASPAPLTSPPIAPNATLSTRGADAGYAPPKPTPGVPSLFTEDEDDPMFQSHVFSWDASAANATAATATAAKPGRDMDIIPEETASEANSANSDRINVPGMFQSQNSGNGIPDSGKLPSTQSETYGDAAAISPARLTTATSLPPALSSDSLPASASADAETREGLVRYPFAGLGQVVSRVAAGVDSVLSGVAEVGHSVGSDGEASILADKLDDGAFTALAVEPQRRRSGGNKVLNAPAAAAETDPTSLDLSLPVAVPALKKPTSTDASATPVNVAVAAEDGDVTAIHHEEDETKECNALSSETQTGDSLTDKSRLPSEVSGSDVETTTNNTSNKKKKGKKGKRR